VESKPLSIIVPSGTFKKSPTESYNPFDEPKSHPLDEYTSFQSGTYNTKLYWSKESGWFIWDKTTGKTQGFSQTQNQEISGEYSLYIQEQERASHQFKSSAFPTQSDSRRQENLSSDSRRSESDRKGKKPDRNPETPGSSRGNPDRSEGSKGRSNPPGGEPPEGNNTSRAMSNQPFIKFPKPSKFLGNASLFRPWLASLELYYSSIGSFQDTQKVNYALGLMDDNAAYWRDDYTTEHPERQTWQEFKDALTQAFAPHQKDYEYEQRLRFLRQQGRYIETYISEFSVMANAAKIKDSVTTRSLFADGLDWKIREEAIRDDPTTLEEWKAAARKAYQIVGEQAKIRNGRTRAKQFDYGKN